MKEGNEVDWKEILLLNYRSQPRRHEVMTAFLV